MRQEYKYEVIQRNARNSSILTPADGALVGTYLLGSVTSFNPEESRLDVNIYDVNGNFLESYRGVEDYTIRGVEQGPEKTNRLVVDPTIYMQDRTFLGNIIVEYKAFNNLYSKGAELYITDISADRTEIRAKSLTVSLQDLRHYTTLLQSRLNDESYFSEAYLESGDIQIPVINALTEIVGTDMVVTFKLYSPLPDTLTLKSKFKILENLGEAAQFEVRQTLEVIEDELPELRGPNFGVEIGTATLATDYFDYKSLLSAKSFDLTKELYTPFKQNIYHLSINYDDFSEFVHFSSAFERLENARYKFELIFDYQQEILNSNNDEEKRKYQKMIDGIIENFDHYENYLYFESGSSAWPKKVDEETGLVIRPYQNETDPLRYEEWYNGLINLAEGYDNNNKDLLISTIPAAIREDLDNNEPYLIFIHMIGQHFDDLWLYAKAITDRYKADNRLDFGISKELVKDAIENFGIELYESNQNLNALFELCQPDGTYDWGLENPEIKNFMRVDPEWTEQPMLRENYTKQVYKRIYHNIPALLKMRGTSRGLRVLLNCFGIPNDILRFKVQGGVDRNKRPYFGPEESIDISWSGSVDKIRTKNRNTPITEFEYENGTGSFYSTTLLSRYTSVSSSNSTLSDDSHKVEVGFDVNAFVNRIFEENLDDFTVDDVIGDPRNLEEHYGDPWRTLRESLLSGVNVENELRTPAAIIRFARYFDVTFFRMLKDFLPARASIDSDVIIKDNVLHRNRWKGVKVEWQELTKSGSITGSKAYGSHGGSFKHVQDGTIYGYNEKGEPIFFQGTGTGSYIVSTGDRWQDRAVPSGSREFNGELAGSKIQVTDGELNPKNTHKKDRQPENVFDYQIWFLDLPDPPLCTCKALPDYFGEYWNFTSRGDSQSAAILVGQSTPMIANKRYYAFSTESMDIISTVKSHWDTWPSTGSKVFMGWYHEENVPRNYGTAVTPGKSLHLDDFKVDDPQPNYRWVAAYASRPGSEYTLWLELKRPTPDGQVYYGGDILLAWKYLKRGDNPDTTPTRPDEAVYHCVGKSKVRIDFEDRQAIITVPASVLFGTNNAYYWAGVQRISEMPYGNYGMVSFGDGATGPIVLNRAIVDATWYDSYGEWPVPEWDVTVLATGSKGSNWQDTWIGV